MPALPTAACVDPNPTGFGALADCMACRRSAMVARRLNGMAAIAGLRGLRGLRGLGQPSGMDIFGEPIVDSGTSDYTPSIGQGPSTVSGGGDTSGFWSNFGKAIGTVMGSATGQVSQAAINQGVCAINPADPRCAPAALKKIGTGGGMPWGTIALVGGGALVLLLLLGRRKAAA